jgi:ribonuclease PH
MRPIKIVKNYIQHAEGSCLYSSGNTVVLCVATVEEKVPPFIEKKMPVQGWVTAEYAMLPRAGTERSPRAKGGGGRAQEISRLIGRSLRAVVDMQKLGKRTITLDCDVIKADGGTRTASVNGAFIALSMALKKLYKEGKVIESPLLDNVGAISVGLVDGKLAIDLCYEQDVKAEVDLNVVMTGKGRLIEVQGTAEHKPFTRKDLDHMVDGAAKAIKTIIALQKKTIK